MSAPLAIRLFISFFGSLFEIKNQSHWALLHSYESVLEKHHSSECHELLADPTTNVISELSPRDKAWITSLLTKAILSTDMALHKTLLDQMQVRIARNEPFDINDENDRRSLVCFILHCAGN